MILILTKIWSAITNIFQQKNVKAIIAVCAIIMLSLITCQHYSIQKLKGKVAAAEMKSTLSDRNAQTLKDSARYWIAKDSSNVATVGLLSATNDTWKTQFADLNNQFNDLIYKNEKNVQKQTLLQTQIAVKDSIIASLTRNGATNTTGSYVANDSTLRINEVHKYDSVNYNSLTGNVSLHIDSNKIKSASLSLKQSFGIGINLATYRTAKGIPQVSVATKYPGAILSVSGIQDVNDQITSAVAKTKTKSSFGIGLQAGYGYTFVPGATIQRGVYVGIGLGWQPSFLRFNKK